MSPALKFLAGLAAVAAIGWVHHGLLGNGERLVGHLEGQARIATISGNANRFQREGQGELKGIKDHVRGVPGISGVRWADEPHGTEIPLLLELLLQLIAAYLVGLGLAKLLFGRRRREGFY
jgi:hypothetical protein